MENNLIRKIDVGNLDIQLEQGSVSRDYESSNKKHSRQVSKEGKAGRRKQEAHEMEAEGQHLKCKQETVKEEGINAS